MIKILLVLIVFNVSAKSINSYYSIRTAVKKTSKKELMNELRNFIDSARPNRFFGTVGHKKAQSYLEKQLTLLSKDKSYSLKAKSFRINNLSAKQHFEDEFNQKIKENFSKNSKEYKKWFSFKKYMQSLIDSKKDVQAKNFNFYIPGKSDKEIIITAHYDTVSHDPVTRKIDENAKMPGADYNGTGVAIALNMIKTFPAIKPKLSVRFIFLDAASLGFLGAQNFVKNIRDKENILGVVNLEMLGHDSTLFDKKEKKKNMRVYLRSGQEDLKFLKLFESQKKRSSYQHLFDIVQNNFERSDHVKFWDGGIPAIVYTQNWENDFNSKRYQTKNDFAEAINQSTFYSSYKFIAEMLLATVFGLD